LWRCNFRFCSWSSPQHLPPPPPRSPQPPSSLSRRRGGRLATVRRYARGLSKVRARTSGRRSLSPLSTAVRPVRPSCAGIDAAESYPSSCPKCLVDCPTSSSRVSTKSCQLSPLPSP
jgi:hypothetical protein